MLPSPQGPVCGLACLLRRDRYITQVQIIWKRLLLERGPGYGHSRFLKQYFRSSCVRSSTKL